MQKSPKNPQKGFIWVYMDLYGGEKIKRLTRERERKKANF